MDELEAVGDPDLRETLLWARAEARPRRRRPTGSSSRDPSQRRPFAARAPGRPPDCSQRASSVVRVAADRAPAVPSKVYAVAPGLAAIEFPARRYESLLGLLVAGPTDRRPSSQTLREVGVAFGHELAQTARLRPATTLATGFDRMCAAVRSLGYQAAVSEVTESGAVIATPTCPLRPLVRAGIRRPPRSTGACGPGSRRQRSPTPMPSTSGARHATAWRITPPAGC